MNNPTLADVARAGGKELLDRGKLQAHLQIHGCALMPAALFLVVRHATILREQGVHRFLLHWETPRSSSVLPASRTRLPLGSTQRRKTELGRFRQPLVDLTTARTSPRGPTSPSTSVPEGSARSRKEETRAAADGQIARGLWQICAARRR